MGAKITYTIGFKPQEKDLKSIQKQLRALQKNASVMGDPKAAEEIKGAYAHIQTILAKAKASMKGGFVPESDFQELSTLFTELQTKIKGVQGALSGLSIPQSTLDQISQLETKVKELNNANRGAGNAKKKLGQGYTFDESGKATAKKQTIDTFAAQVAQQQSLTGPNGEAIKSAEQLNALLATMDGRTKKVRETRRLLNQAIVDGEQAATQAYQQQQQIIDENRQRVQELRTEIAELRVSAGPDAHDVFSRSGKIGSKMESIVAQQAAPEKREVDPIKASTEAAKAQGDNAKAVRQTTQATQQLAKTEQRYQSTQRKTLQNAVLYRIALSALRAIYQQTISTLTDMDKALTEMTVVTDLNREQAWGLTNQLADLAKQTGMTTTEVANMTTKYLQQGKTLSDAITLTEAAAKAARIAGISGEESINLLTNAMNGFQLSADKAMEVSDKFASLAAASATDYEELATALSKVASQANLAGMSMDFTLGLLAKGIETTREAPETIGTALKTVISRMRELTDYGDTLEDGTDINRVEAALNNVGVALRDSNGEFRDLDDVLTELGGKWDTLNKNAQANVAVALAGTRQQSRLIAMMQDFDRTQQLVNISMNSAGSTAAQHAKYMEGLEAATSRMTTSYQGLVTSFMNSDFMIGVVNGLANALEYLGNNMGIVYAALAATGTIMAVVVAQKIQDALITAEQNRLAQEKAAIENNAAVAEAKRIEAEKEQLVITTQQTHAEAQKRVVIAESKLEQMEATKAVQENTIAQYENMLAAATAANNTEMVAQAQAGLAKAKTKLAETETAIAQQQIEIEQARTAEKEAAAAADAALIEKQKATHAVSVAMQMAQLALQNRQKGNILQLISAKAGQATASFLVAAGATAEEAAETGANLSTALGILLSKKATAEERKEATATMVSTAAKIGGAAGSMLKGAADLFAAGASGVLTAACGVLSTAIMNIPIIGWIAAIIALVIALFQASKETGAMAEAMEAFKSIGQALMDVLGALFNAISVIFNAIVQILTFALC